MHICTQNLQFLSEGNRLAQGRDSVKDLILDNPELMVELEGKIRARIKDDENALLDDVPIGATEDDDEGEIDD